MLLLCSWKRTLVLPGSGGQLNHLSVFWMWRVHIQSELWIFRGPIRIGLGNWALIWAWALMGVFSNWAQGQFSLFSFILVDIPKLPSLFDLLTVVFSFLISVLTFFFVFPVDSIFLLSFRSFFHSFPDRREAGHLYEVVDRGHGSWVLSSGEEQQQQWAVAERRDHGSTDAVCRDGFAMVMWIRQ